MIGGKKRRGDDSPEQQRGAVELSLAPAQKINSRDGQPRARECQPCITSGTCGKCNERENRAQRRAARNSQHIRIGQRIAQQRLKTCARNRKRRAHQNPKRDARQPQIKNDQAVVAVGI